MGATGATGPTITEIAQSKGMAIEHFDDYAVGTISVADKGWGWVDNGVISGGNIGTQTHIDGRPEQRLQLNGSGAQYGRRMPWGGKWNRIKIAIVWRINGGVTFANADGYVGVCSGTTNMVASATTNNFIGARTGDGASNATFGTGTSADNFDIIGGYRFYSRRATTSTFVAVGGSGHHISATEGYLSAFVYEVERPVFATDATSVTYTHKEVSPVVGLIEFSRSKDAVKFLLNDIPGIITAASNADAGIAGSQATGSGAFDQSTGVLDTLNISWPMFDGLQIAALGVRKFY
jgi:hypothetical protein